MTNKAAKGVGNRGQGRVKGTPNKTTKALKEAILAAFEEVGAETYLATVARENPKVFCALLSRVLPMTISGEDGGPVRFMVGVGEAPSAQAWMEKHAPK
jgi:hypothetical protein